MSRDVIHIEITYDAPISKVWEALTDKDSIKEWYFNIPDFSVEKGAEFDFYKAGFKREFLHRCKILEVSEKNRLQYSWAYPNHSEGTSVVTWELIPRGTVTCVRLTHEGLRNHHDAGEKFSPEKFDEGWNNILGKSLSNYLEKEKTVS